MKDIRSLREVIPQCRNERPIATILHLSDEEIKKRFPVKRKARYSCKIHRSNK